MPKGNHVFNNFDGTVHNAFMVVLEAFKHDDALKAVNGSGGDADKGAQLLTAKYENAYRFYGEIKRHPAVALIHATQDDEEVVSDDPNSIAFGKLAKEFNMVAVSWAWGTEGANPLEQWRQLVNAGYDKEARDNYVKKGSSVKGTPASEMARAARCAELQQFIKGDLTRLATNWMLGLRMDLKTTKAVEYSEKINAWKALLETATTPLK